MRVEEEKYLKLVLEKVKSKYAEVLQKLGSGENE